ncbi:hypothetical protein FC093_19990 [Ilyomonas limi]|uniref:Cytochrome c domain-containing protein n=1 Tax=Ilyomonas limi TaxID=2575867 RepID=A0A4V5UTP8_9BACT|nr:hypothetical protein [Ilyomonas limi]TKK65393.1 hypothetical protein FC093_19990 [Ilyomonas limi]
MKKYVITGFLFVCIFAFRKAPDNEKSAEINSAIGKSLVLLQNSSHEFLENAVVCHSCHNQGIGVVAFSLAKEKGFDVSDGKIKEALDSTLSWWNRSANTQTLAENSDPVAITMTGNYDL